MNIRTFGGLMHMVYSDNGRDLVALAVRATLARYGIWLKKRPKGMAWYGGYSERTFLNRITTDKTLAASAHLSPREVKRLLNRQRLTLEAFTAMYRMEVYHLYANRVHSALGYTPLDMIDLLMIGSSRRAGRGAVRVIPADQRDTVQLSFMKAQRYKVHKDGVRVMGYAFRNAELMRRSGEKVLVRLDPSLKLAHVHVWLPDETRYLKVPRFHDNIYPPPHVDEVNDARRIMREEAELAGQRPDYNEFKTDAVIERQRAIDKEEYERGTPSARGRSVAVKHEKRTGFAKDDGPADNPHDAGEYEQVLTPSANVADAAQLAGQGDVDDT